MADGTERPSRWVPTTDLVELAVLGKLGEELGELTSIVSRIIIQGIDEADPDTGKSNRVALAEEIADVLGMMSLVRERYDLDVDAISTRADRKVAMKKAWHAMLRDGGDVA